MNYLLVDPYYDQRQFILFQSSEKFYDVDTVKNKGNRINLDIIVKTIVYKINDDTKLIVQYPDHLIEKKLEKSIDREKKQGLDML